MRKWTVDELAAIGAADELEISTRRRDGTLRNPVTIWVVRVADDLYLRSVNGPTAAWFRGTRTRDDGHIEAGGMARDVSFAAAEHDIDDRIDDAYRAKYSYLPSAVDAINSPEARSTTIKLVPHGA
jgi:hypothetical protein